MQNFEFLGRPVTSKKKRRAGQIIQENLDKITKYLNNEDTISLKLTCRPFYYYFVTAELWLGLKLNIAQQKLEHFDDFEFVEEPETKQITKKDKNIRIHSLKKQNEDRMKKLPQRQASNIKQKAKVINQNNELLFRNTEIGFKRLLKTNSKKKVEGLDYEMKETEDLPKIGDIAGYLIKINDPWSVNMSKAQNIINLFKKLNQFHHKLLTELKMSSKDFSHLLQKLRKIQQKTKLYSQQIQSQPYKSVVSSTQGCKQNLLIDEQLNKVCRLFWNYHGNALLYNKQVGPLCDIVKKEKGKLEQITKQSKSNQTKESVNFVQTLSNVDEAVDTIMSFLQENKQLGQLLAPQIISIFCASIDALEHQNVVFEDTLEQISMQTISWRVLIRKPFFSETMLQILVSIASKLLKSSSTLCSEDITISINLNKLKSVKTVSQNLLNIAKYFGKIKKQIQQKQKKGKDSKTSDSIKNFFAYYESKQKSEESLYLTKNTVKLDKIISEFKEKVASLKSKIQSN